MAASMASFILGAGERGKRVALPHSRVMIHQPMGGSEGQAEDIRVEAEQILKIKGTLVTMYAQMTGQTRERIIKDLDRDNYMSAEQAHSNAFSPRNPPARPLPPPSHTPVHTHTPPPTHPYTPVHTRTNTHPYTHPYTHSPHTQALEYGLIDKIVTNVDA